MKMKSGFTLIEMMTVVVIIAIVASITMASAQYLVRNGRRQRAKVTCLTLETALNRYRHEYKEWPGLGSVPGLSGDKAEDVAKVVFLGKKNGVVLSPLRENHSGNSKHVRFIDETAFYTADTYDKATKALTDTADSAEKPFAYRAPTTGHARFFKVTINLDDDTVSVEMTDDSSDKIETIDRDDL